MASVVELPSGRLLCVLESVQTSPPHANCIRLVSSDDGGRTWSWQQPGASHPVSERANPTHLAVSPWVSRLPGGPLLCVFATDEDQPSPSPSGTHPWHLKTDMKYVFSLDEGRSWSHAAQTDLCRDPSLLRSRRPAAARRFPAGDLPGFCDRQPPGLSRYHRALSSSPFHNTATKERNVQRVRRRTAGVESCGLRVHNAWNVS